MKKITIVICLVFAIGASVFGEELSRKRQMQIIQEYLYATGQRELLASLSLEDGLPEGVLKCGTPAILNFVMNRDKLDPDLLKSLGVQLQDRPTGLEDSVLSPSGVFAIHYTTGGIDRIYTGFEGYADSVAAIYDEVYAYFIDTLEYPAPPSDGFYPEGGGDAFDIYLIDLGTSYYGLTYTDSILIDGPLSTRATAFQVLDNDYDHVAHLYPDRLDAVRVTCAHEFFHVVQFGIDFTEFPDQGPYWMEMSATWMEEMKYDYINDYYYYLPSFYVDPRLSFERFDSSYDLHPYGSMVFPLFLSERFGTDMIRDIWLKCADLGQGSQFLPAAGEVIDSATSGQESFATAFQEFALWNYFTENRSVLAPAGMGYSERFDWGDTLGFTELPPDPAITVLNSYEDTVSVSGFENTYNPDHNAAFYLKLDELRLLKPDTTYWVCNSGSFPACDDSAQVIDPLADYDIMYVDSTLSVTFALASTFPYDWGFSTIFQFEDNLDSAEVIQTTLPRGAIDTVEFEYEDYSQWRSVAFVLTPASDNPLLFTPLFDYDIGYSLSAELSILDSAMMNLPGAVMAPYPNPVVVSELISDMMTFKFQVPTDSLGFPIYGESYSGSEPYLIIDIFSVAGDHVCTLDETAIADERLGEYTVEWDLENAGGEDVASGVYIIFGRLFDSSSMRILLAEDKTKVVVIR